jgi:threonine/homoserine/homoserine lactone efflux protein
VGAGYILYLAYGILKASYDFTEQSEANPLGVGSGFLVQILNPKLYVYAFTLFSAFLASITGNIALLGTAAMVLAVVSFVATSVWALFGAVINTYLQHPRVKMAVNIILALFLVYTAIELLNIF